MEAVKRHPRRTSVGSGQIWSEAGWRGHGWIVTYDPIRDEDDAAELYPASLSVLHIYDETGAEISFTEAGAGPQLSA